MTKTTKHYVNNADFLSALIDYRDKCAIAKKDGKEDPQIPNYIGECFYKIADHLSRKPNFISYSFRDEMISDGIENCLMYFRNFDPDKSKNPFAYFTQIIYYAFLRRIAKEKKQTYIKGKLLQNMPFEAFELQDHEDDRDFHNAYLEFMQNNSNFDDFIERKKEAKKKKTQTNLDAFIELEDDIMMKDDDNGEIL